MLAAGDGMHRAKRTEEGTDGTIWDFTRKVAKVDQSLARLDVRKANAVTTKYQATQYKGLHQVLLFEGETTGPMTEELDHTELVPTDSLDQLREDGGGANTFVNSQ